MATNTTHSKTYPIHRQNLADYFPSTAKFYPGYVKMAVFRERLKTLLSAVSVGGDIRGLMLIGVDEDLTAKLQAELRKKAKEYGSAAIIDPATQFVGGKTVKKVSGYAKAGLTKVAANPKVNAKVGKAINVISKDYQYGDISLGKIKIGPKTYQPSINIIDVNFVDSSVDHVMGKATDGVKNWTGNKTGFQIPNGVEVSLNNETTRGWVTRFGVPEGVANWSLELIDILSDFFPPASLTKSIEGFFANAALSFRYWSDARSMEETKKFFNQKWNEITSKLKIYIKQDLKALSDKEFTDLCNLLYN